MSRENQIKFDSEKIKCYLVFEAYIDGFDFGGEEEICIEVGCDEDIENYMKLYYKESWEELFETTEYDSRDISYARYGGLRISAEDQDGNKLWFTLFKRPTASIHFNVEKLGEENATKIDEIRKIIGR